MIEGLRINYIIFGVGWALPTVNSRDRWYLVGKAHPTIKTFFTI